MIPSLTHIFHNNVFIKSFIFLVPILELQFWQIGFKLETINSPPFDSATICPQLNESWVISVILQQRHFALPNSSPIWVFHTRRLIVAEIGFFFPFFLTSFCIGTTNCAVLINNFAYRGAFAGTIGLYANRKNGLSVTVVVSIC